MSARLNLSYSYDSSQSANTEIFIGDLSPSVTAADLYQYFSQFGQVLSTKVVPSSYPTLSANYGLVKFMRHEDGKIQIL